MKLQNYHGNPSVRLSVKMATKDALENLNTQENMKKDFNRYFAENVWKILNFISQIKVQTFERVEFSIDTIQDKYVKNPRLLT